MKNRITAAVVFCIFLAVFLISGLRLTGYINETGKAEKVYDQARESYRANYEAETEDNVSERELPEGMVGWISCEGTEIDYPVMQAADNAFYLTHLYDGQINSSGSIFMDCANVSADEDQNVILYGHHMKNGSMFAGLTKYKDQQYYEMHPTMSFMTGKQEYTVELICGTVENGSQDILKCRFESDSALLDYVDSFVSRSVFKSSTKVSTSDRIITLCTCSYENNNARFVLIGKLIPDE